MFFVSPSSLYRMLHSLKMNFLPDIEMNNCSLTACDLHFFFLNLVRETTERIICNLFHGETVTYVTHTSCHTSQFLSSLVFYRIFLYSKWTRKNVVANSNHGKRRTKQSKEDLVEIEETPLFSFDLLNKFFTRFFSRLIRFVICSCFVFRLRFVFGSMMSSSIAIKTTPIDNQTNSRKNFVSSASVVSPPKVVHILSSSRLLSFQEFPFFFGSGTFTKSLVAGCQLIWCDRRNAEEYNWRT